MPTYYDPDDPRAKGRRGSAAPPPKKPTPPKKPSAPFTPDLTAGLNVGKTTGKAGDGYTADQNSYYGYYRQQDNPFRNTTAADLTAGGLVDYEYARDNGLFGGGTAPASGGGGGGRGGGKSSKAIKEAMKQYWAGLLAAEAAGRGQVTAAGDALAATLAAQTDPYANMPQTRVGPAINPMIDYLNAAGGPSASSEALLNSLNAMGEQDQAAYDDVLRRLSTSWQAGQQGAQADVGRANAMFEQQMAAAKLRALLELAGNAANRGWSLKDLGIEFPATEAAA